MILSDINPAMLEVGRERADEIAALTLELERPGRLTRLIERLAVAAP